MYISHNTLSTPTYTLDPDWGWEVATSPHNPATDETTITLTVGYDTMTYSYVVVAQGDHHPTAAAEAYVLTLSEFENSTGPIGGGGFPPPPVK